MEDGIDVVRYISECRGISNCVACDPVTIGGPAIYRRRVLWADKGVEGEELAEPSGVQNHSREFQELIALTRPGGHRSLHVEKYELLSVSVSFLVFLIHGYVLHE